MTLTFLYDGDALAAEYEGAMVVRRYAHGANAGADDPIVWYEGTQRRFLRADHQGSIVQTAGSTGAPFDTNAYDEYGIPGAGNAGRFQYTGQIWLPELGLYHYKARVYSPTLGRFLQTDPTGYDDGMNVYAYVGNDPVNRMDPDGRQGVLAICLSPAAPICAGPGAVFASFAVIEGWVLWMAGPPIDPANPPTLAGDIPASDRRVSRNDNGGPPLRPRGQVAAPPPTRNADADRRSNIARGIPASRLGPSGRPMRHFVQHNSRSAARDAAQDRTARGQTPMGQSNPRRGDPHFHARDAQGNRRQDSVHNNYPRRGTPGRDDY